LVEVQLVELIGFAMKRLLPDQLLLDLLQRALTRVGDARVVEGMQ
jgi:hypothetical protein